MSAGSAKKLSLQTVLAASDDAELSARVRTFAQQLTNEISDTCPEQDEKVLSLLLAELALSAADQRRRRERLEHQRECVEAAKARGVQFGRKYKPLPDAFDTYYQAWQNGDLSAVQAAKYCGMSKTTFRRAIQRKMLSETENP